MISRALFGEPVTGLPARMEPNTPGLPIVDFGGEAAVVFGVIEDVWQGRTP